MSTSIEEQLASLVDAERERPVVGNAAADRVWSGVQARLEGAPPPASVPANTPWGLLSAVGVVALLGLSVAGWMATRPPAQRFESLPPAPAWVVEAAGPGAPTLHAELPVEGTPAPEVAPAVETPAKRVRRENAGTVADELALIERARTALDRGNAKAALSVLGTHRRQFPKGAFLEEAAALRASALCEAGRTEAAQKASAAFLRRYPRSVHAARVRGCSA